MKDNEQKIEEQKNKKQYFNMCISGITVIIFYTMLIILTIYTLEGTTLCNIIIGTSTIVFVLFCFYLVKVEVDIGYYECHNCHHKFVPSYIQVAMMSHMIKSRYLKCPKCGKRTWAKKTMTME